MRGNDRDMDVIRNAKDNCLKLILGEHELFSEFLVENIEHTGGKGNVRHRKL